MSYSVLSTATRQQLEQERARLLKDRTALIQAAVADATTEVDRLLQHLNGLLGTEAAPISAERNTAGSSLAEAALSTTPTAKVEDLPAPEEAAAPTKPKRAQPAAAKGQRKPNSAFDLHNLKPEFATLTPIAAMQQLLQASPDQDFTPSDLIDRLYDAFDSTDLPKARKSIGGTLAWGVRQGLFQRTSNTPPRFRAADTAAAQVA